MTNIRRFGKKIYGIIPLGTIYPYLITILYYLCWLFFYVIDVHADNKIYPWVICIIIQIGTYYWQTIKFVQDNFYETYISFKNYD